MASVRKLIQQSSMVPPTPSSSQKLSDLAFRHSKTIEEILFNSGLGDRVPHFFASFHSLLARSADDAMATANLLRFLESSFNRTTLLRDLDDHSVLFETLLLIFGSSQYFSDILIRDPELFRWLTATKILETTRTKDDFLIAARQSIEPFQTTARKINVLKRFQRREMLRVGVRDLLHLAGLETTTLELSHIADAVVALTAELTMGEMRLQYGFEPNASWTIMGLGKLGGEELNYSSDIDLIALFESDGEMSTKAGVKLTYGEFFVRFVERLAETLASPTEEGYFYRVDLRLRPDGKSGTLIRTFASTMMYYESRGEIWERQMLIKARHIAGSLELSRKFLDAVIPFVYPRTFFRNPIEEISRIKSRIESDAGEHNIKLRAGGIRDIEFIVQALQLVNGGKIPAIRNANTLATLGLLQGNSLLSET
jgi:[glutamine synthetase] adenylyltransferase / [glutamine synthetase]-adenylyl-L-tyrosine phosphorylase